MFEDRENQYRPLLEDDPPAFLDKVNTPWDRVPDLEEYNRHAYNRVVRALKALERERSEGGGATGNTQGLLILGEAGTGKTHLLMRVARNLSSSNHILFVNKPANQHAVAQHIWANVVKSLARSLPESGSSRSQLDDLLAHVFRDILVTEFERDIAENKDADKKRRWVERLKADPFNLFTMLGEGEQRQKNLDQIRNRTLSYLKSRHPEVDQQIARALITYCFVASENRKTALLTWLSGQDLDADEAKELGLPPSWVTFDETADDSSVQQRREDRALRAIYSVATLSTHYQPLILAFDQLEGLRGNEGLTLAWGDAVREIFTHAPNMLVVTCIFPSLWREWFEKLFETRAEWKSVQERFAQQKVELEPFSSQHGLKLLAGRLEPSFTKHRLPSSIFPFTEEDVPAICARATSPRNFLQSAHDLFQKWLDGEVAAQPPAPKPVVATQEAVDALIRTTLVECENEYKAAYAAQIPDEQDFFGRVRNVLETILTFADERVTFGQITCGGKVMPPNLVLRAPGDTPALCLSVSHAAGNSLAACVRNLLTVLKEGKHARRAVLIRDRRCKGPGKATADSIAEFERLGGVYLIAGPEELSVLNAIYDTLVAVEEHDLSVGAHQVDKRQFAHWLRTEGTVRRSQFLRAAAVQFPPLERALGTGLTNSPPASAPPPSPPNGAVPRPTGSAVPGPATLPPKADTRRPPNAATAGPGVPSQRPAVDVVIGSRDATASQLGLLGTLKHDRRRVAVSFSKPTCAVILGYMGSGKSYALGVLMENALLRVPNVTANDRPLAVVAFNYRKSGGRFEYAGFARPNDRAAEVGRLQGEYQARPAGVERLNVLGYGPELERRKAEYHGLPTFPIKFRPGELGVEHWEILMKPPNAQAEYMSVVRSVLSALFYSGKLTYQSLEYALQTDDRLNKTQRQRAMNRLSFARDWVTDERAYEWADLLAPGTMNVVDLRGPTLAKEDALKLCLVVTDLVRRTKSGANKMIVFDEAHEYVDCKELVGELENAITQIRHDGLSFVLATQSPQRIPERVFKYLLTRLVFKLSDAKDISAVRRAAPNLDGLSPRQVSNLDLEQGVCLIQTDDDCTDPLLKVPQLMAVRPRCSEHGGETVRNAVPGGSES